VEPTRAILVQRSHRFLGFCEDAGVPTNQTHEREATRTCIFDGAQTLAAALIECDGSERHAR
jgi:hypothetical protein